MTIDIDALTNRLSRYNDLSTDLERLQAWIEETTLPLIKDYATIPGTKVPCGTDVWKFSGSDHLGLHFRHDCWDHGYDLPDSEYLTLPWLFIEDRETFVRQQEQQVERERQRQLELQIASFEKQIMHFTRELTAAENQGGDVDRFIHILDQLQTSISELKAQRSATESEKV